MAQEIRLYIHADLALSQQVHLDSKQSHYLANVMRCQPGDKVSMFNGKDGQWSGEITALTKKSVSVVPTAQTRPQSPSPDVWLVFSALKNKSELVVEKATELGASKIIPLVTRHCVARSLNMEKLQAHAIEASEQCERLDIPALETHKDLSYLLGSWEAGRTLLYGDETGGGISLANILEDMKKQATNTKIAVLIGPEGGFADDELSMLRRCDFTRPFGMGGRILRADTAATAALACIQAQFGDWDVKPHFVRKN